MRKKLHFLLLAIISVFCSGSVWGQTSGDVITVSGVKYNVLSDNLFTNGSFDDGVNGWKATNYTTDAVASNFTHHSTGGYDDGAFLETAAAGAGAATSARQAIAVTNNKKYYFCVYTSRL